MLAQVYFLLLLSLEKASHHSIFGWIVPVALIAYPFTFLLTDTIAEIYGRSTAMRVVWLGFTVNVLMVILTYVRKIIPPASF